MNDTTDDALLSYTQTLTSTHVSAAFMALHEAINAHGPFQLLIRQHRAIATVIHCHSALESALNFLGHQIFTNTKSPHYIPPVQRDVPLETFAREWSRRTSLIDKLRFVLSRAGLSKFGQLESLVREIGVLRNWLVHGLFFESTLLVQRSGPNTLSVYDREDSIDWKKPFPNAKFNTIDQLDHRDAKVALRILLLALCSISRATGDSFLAADFRDGTYKLIEIKPTTDGAELINLLLQDGRQ